MRTRQVLLGLIALLGAAMAPLLVVDAPHHDQQRYFFAPGRAACDFQPQYRLLYWLGRPPAAEIECRLGRVIETPADLAAVRGAALVLLALLGLTVQRTLKSYGLGERAAFLGAVATTLLPGAQNLVLMNNLPTLLGYLLVFYADGLAAPRPNAPPWLKRLGTVLAAIFTLAAFYFYQPAFFLTLGLLALRFLVDANEPKPFRRLLVSGLVLAGLAGVYHYTLTHGLRQVFPPGYEPETGGYGIELAFRPNRLALLPGLLRDLFGLWVIQPRWSLWIAPFVCAGLGVLLFRRDVADSGPSGPGRFLRPLVFLGPVAALCGFYALTEAPPLYRAMFGVQAFFVMAGGVMLGRRFAGAAPRRSVAVAGTAFVAGLAGLAFVNSLDTAGTDKIELVAVRELVRETVGGYPAEITFLDADGFLPQGLTGGVRRTDEFSVTSSGYVGSLFFLVQHLLLDVAYDVYRVQGTTPLVFAKRTAVGTLRVWNEFGRTFDASPAPSDGAGPPESPSFRVDEAGVVHWSNGALWTPVGIAPGPGFVVYRVERRAQPIIHLLRGKENGRRSLVVDVGQFLNGLMAPKQ